MKTLRRVSGSIIIVLHIFLLPIFVGFFILKYTPSVKYRKLFMYKMLNLLKNNKLAMVCCHFVVSEPQFAHKFYKKSKYNHNN